MHQNIWNAHYHNIDTHRFIFNWTFWEFVLSSRNKWHGYLYGTVTESKWEKYVCVCKEKKRRKCLKRTVTLNKCLLKLQQQNYRRNSIYLPHVSIINFFSFCRYKRLPFRPKIEEKRLSEWLVKLYKIYQWYDVNAVCLNQYRGTAQPLRPIIYKWKELDSGYTRKDENEKRNKTKLRNASAQPWRWSTYKMLTLFMTAIFHGFIFYIMVGGYNASSMVIGIQRT